MIDDTEDDASSGDSRTGYAEDRNTETDATSGVSRHNAEEPRTTEGDASSAVSRHNDEEPRAEADATSGVSRHNAEEPLTDEPTMSLAEAEALALALLAEKATRRRLLRRRAELIERRNVIVLGKARDDYNRMIERIDRRLGATGGRGQPTG